MNNTQHMRSGRAYEVFGGIENKEMMGDVCNQSKQSNRRVLTSDWLCLFGSLPSPTQPRNEREVFTPALPDFCPLFCSLKSKAVTDLQLWEGYCALYRALV